MSIYRSNSILERLDISLLRHFFAISSFGGFSKASRATGVSQPALSLGLKKLEKEMGVCLIDRKPGKFVLTESGKVLQEFCKRLEGSLESLVGDIDGKKLSVPRRLRIGAGLSVGFGPLVAACIESGRSSRHLELELTAQNSYHLLAEVNEGSLDAALVPDDVFDKRLNIAPLFRDRLVFVHSTRGFEPERWRSGSLPSALLTYPRETPMRSVIDKLCAQHDLRFKSVVAVNGLDAIVRLIKGGVGGAFVLRSLVADELRGKELREARLPFDPPGGGVALVTAKNDNGDETARTLKKMLKNWI
jgi:DNA-binding transcriptional LysR family regulator